MSSLPDRSAVWRDTPNQLLRDCWQESMPALFSTETHFSHCRERQHWDRSSITSVTRTQRAFSQQTSRSIFCRHSMRKPDAASATNVSGTGCSVGVLSTHLTCGGLKLRQSSSPVKLFRVLPSDDRKISPSSAPRIRKKFLEELQIYLHLSIKSEA